MKLRTDGQTENKNNCADYLANPKSYINGSKTFDLKNSIYGHPNVKSALKAAQYDKCCFCEKDLKDEYGAVEHFRPKAGYKSIAKQKLIRPGYYWLGYEWRNLFFVCSVCNSAGNKGNLFPLLDELNRATSHETDVRIETPLLLDPGGRKNPRVHISFEYQFPKGKSKYGKKTIEICGLDREALNDKRKELIDNIDARIVVLGSRSRHNECDVLKAIKFIKNSIKSDAKFSSAASDYLRTFNMSLD